MRTQKAVLALMGAVTAVALAGCGSSTDAAEPKPSRGFMTLAQTQAEYSQTVADFPYKLPAGNTFPAKVQQPKEATIYQKGSGLVQAYQFWECSWMHTFLTDQTAHPAEAAEAVQQLEKGTSSVYRTQYVIDQDQDWSTKVLGQAKLGDPSILSEFYESDCTWYRSANGS